MNFICLPSVVGENTNTEWNMTDPNPIQFFTATILKWKPILRTDGYKQLIIDSLSYLVENKRCKVYAFVIMPNHIHLLWQILNIYKRESVQRDFLKFTGQMIKMNLQENNPVELENYLVNLKDRAYQIWQRNSLSVDMLSRQMIEQKLEYIHNNPVQGKWLLSNNPSDYKYSSDRYYNVGDTGEYPFLSHYMEYFE